MLDTAVIMMQQYNTAAALSMPMPHLNQQTGDNNVTNNNATNVKTKEELSNNDKSEDGASVNNKLNSDNLCTNDNTSKLNNTDATASVDAATDVASSSASSSSSTTTTTATTSLTDSQLPMTKDEEIRKRRLEKFQ